MGMWAHSYAQSPLIFDWEGFAVESVGFGVVGVAGGKEIFVRTCHFKYSIKGTLFMFLKGQGSNLSIFFLEKLRDGTI